MVFFNYSTMQMAAKIVFYGPGLCGKTTNLQHIYGHTSLESRGEMVSLETETDRTLFFDLLPLDVGSIQGFNTRIQLYTVPGQVFYNTTRKLVLKGVDGVVFVADSQRPMLQANVDSLENLRQNLAEIGLALAELPVVLQYNKRDLPDVCSLEDLNQALNGGSWPFYEASAIDGRGVFETLKGISKLTLLSLKKRIAESQRAGRPAAVARQPVAPPAPTLVAVAPRSPALVAAATASVGTATTVAPPAAPNARKPIDVLAELERIRRQAQAGSRVESAPASANGSRRIDRDVRLTLSPEVFGRARRVAIDVRVEDESRQLLGSHHEGVELDDLGDLERLLVHLRIALRSVE